MLLLRRVRDSVDDAEYEMLRQRWDTVNRSQYAPRTWSPKQEEVLGAAAYALSLDDEEEKRRHQRFLYVKGGPGSGKSAVLLELAVRAAKAGNRVLIVCPTGQLVHSFKCQLPEVDGIENVQVDTIHGILRYKRKAQMARSRGPRPRPCAVLTSSWWMRPVSTTTRSGFDSCRVSLSSRIYRFLWRWQIFSSSNLFSKVAYVTTR